jgi:hypothetical protein
VEDAMCCAIQIGIKIRSFERKKPIKSKVNDIRKLEEFIDSNLDNRRSDG